MLNHPDALLHSFLALSLHYGIERQAVDFAEAVARWVAENVVDRTCVDMRSLLEGILADVQVSATSHETADAVAVQHQDQGMVPGLTVTVWQRKERSSRSIRIAFNRLGQQQAGVVSGHRADVSVDDAGNLVLDLSAGGKYVFRSHSRKGSGARLEAILPAGMQDEIRSFTECRWSRDGDRIIIHLAEMAGGVPDLPAVQQDVEEDRLPDDVRETNEWSSASSYDDVIPAAMAGEDSSGVARSDVTAAVPPDEDLSVVDEVVHQVEDDLDAGVVTPDVVVEAETALCGDGLCNDVREPLPSDVTRKRSRVRQGHGGAGTDRLAVSVTAEAPLQDAEADAGMPEARDVPVACSVSVDPVPTSDPVSDLDVDDLGLVDADQREAAMAIERAARQQERLDQVRARILESHSGSEADDAVVLLEGFSSTSRMALKALELDAPRAPAQVTPVSLMRAVDLLREAGVTVEVMGPALMKVDGKTMSRPEMIDHLNKVVAGFERGVSRSDMPRYVLVM